MDKSWIAMPRNSPQYEEGLKGFLDFAFSHRSVNGRIICPCPCCRFNQWETREVVYDHLLYKQFPKGYTTWFRHGESTRREDTNRTHILEETLASEDPMRNMINDAFGVFRNHGTEDFPTPNVVTNGGEGSMPNTNQRQNDQCKEFYELIRDGEQELYDGCTRYSKLSFLVKLYHIKCLCGMSDKSMSMILELLHDAFENAKIPSSFYEAKKTINKLGLNYIKIHACPNDCMLYPVNDKEENSCKVCGTSRWKSRSKGRAVVGGKKRKLVPAKILRYFPLKPRLQRLFMSFKTAADMTWHADAENKDGLLRHPRDSKAWKTFDSIHSEFAKDPRNVRLGLAADGFNPFGNLSTNHSTWPVILIPYNTPPWKCMRQTSFILSMIIPGKKMPGNDIDIYLQPLIEELKELWTHGVETYDASKDEMFNLRAALLWTISDFPGLGTLSGWNTYTGLACPSCNFDSIICRLPHSKKWCFMGHRRFLESGHKFRLDRRRFDGKTEERNPPVTLSGIEIWKQIENLDVTFGKRPAGEVRGKRTRASVSVDSESNQWRKKSIFFQLPYWEYNLLRHNLDVMHIEKNVCDNVVFTLLNETGKSKDNLNARKDLQAWGIRNDLWPNENGNYLPALFTMTNAQKSKFLETLKNITVPDGYSSNISRCVDLKQRKVTGLKSHDSHVIMEQLLPLAIRISLPSQVSAVLVDLCSFFRQLCGKALNELELDKLQDHVVLTLCHLEMLFPPSFFTVMVHLIVHLVEEAKLGGPVYYRWMYPIERYLGLLKSYVRNKAQPEGSIAECYLAQEILTFCSRYLDNIETRWNQPRRVDDEPSASFQSLERHALIPQIGRAIGGSSYFSLTHVEKLQAHRHMLTNCKQVDRFLQEFRNYITRKLRSRTRNTTEIDKKVHREFVGWFKGRILNDENESHSNDLKFLARGPIDQARRFSAYNVNGYKFRTVERDEGLQTQNSGVFGAFGTRSYASSSDSHMRFGAVPYYGRVIDIIELNYHGRFMVTLFKCQWANTTNPRGITKDGLGFTKINFSRLIHTGEHEDDEPYIQASEAQMVYYVEDGKEKDWYIPVHLKPRDLFDMGEDDEGFYENEPFEPQDLSRFFPDEATNLQLARDDVDDEPPVLTNDDDVVDM